MSQRSSMAYLGYFVCLGLSLGACIGTVNVGGGSDTGGAGGTGGGGGPVNQAKANKVDLLLVVDNSRSMADKQEVLARSAADLVQSVTNPPCVDANGNLGMTPASPLDPCPAGQTRRYTPVSDIHVGVISTSIGGHGSDSCPDDDVTSCQPAVNHTNNDKGHLLSRGDACETTASTSTYQGKGFLAWDALQSMSPPGSNDASALAADVAAMVRGVGQIGCGFESQLESWYRFLADPEPYESIAAQNFVATPLGIDTALLQQRANFLRPDSMLVILMLTDEDDCSIMEYGQFYYVAQAREAGGQPVHLPRARSVCATNPDDPCCKSCGQAADTCPADPTCVDPNGTGGPAMLSDIEDSLNLRCFDQKRRFGIDFLYPVDRYINALTQPTVTNRSGQSVPNPIFSDLDPSDGVSPARDPGLVFFASISGVPWQQIARNPADLKLGYQNADELVQNGTWNAILGSGSNPPTNANMIASIDPRAGVSTDRAIPQRDDLQYSCTFPLDTSRDCSDPNLTACDCTDPNNNSPICNGTTQIAAKAYPSPRTMKVVQSLGDQGVLTSICPAQTTDPSQADYAYRPVVQALLERVAGHLE